MRAPAVLIFPVPAHFLLPRNCGRPENPREKSGFLPSRMAVTMSRRPDLIAEEMRRGQHHLCPQIGRIGREPVDAGEMKAADAAGLVASRTGHVVGAAAQSPRPSGCFASRCRAPSPSSGPRQRRFAEHGVRTLPCTRPESRLQLRGRKSDRSRSNGTEREEFLLAESGMLPRSSSPKCTGSSSHALELAPGDCRRPKSASRSIWFSSGASSNNCADAS